MREPLSGDPRSCASYSLLHLRSSQMRERDNMDAPMKNQLQYYLRRHLDDEKENRGGAELSVGYC